MTAFLSLCLSNDQSLREQWPFVSLILLIEFGCVTGCCFGLSVSPLLMSLS